MSTVPIFSFGGAVARVPDDAMAFPYRDAAHDINIVGSWLPERPPTPTATSAGSEASSAPSSRTAGAFT